MSLSKTAGRESERDSHERVSAQLHRKSWNLAQLPSQMINQSLRGQTSTRSGALLKELDE